MVVAFAKGLESLKADLKKYGFDTVTYGEYHHHIDALVYSGSFDMTAMTNSYSSTVPANGIFMINSNGKSAYDIANILRRKAYSPLF